MAPSLDEVVPGLATLFPKKLERLDHDVSKGLRVVQRILSSTESDLQNRRFLLDSFHEYGMPFMTGEYWQPWEKYMNESGFGAMQIPTEIVDCLRRLMPLKIKSAIEIGVYRGGLSYFMAAVLQRVSPDFTLTMVDPFDSLLGFEQFSKILNLKKTMPSTSSDFSGQAFELVFIDGDHTYAGAMRDYTNLGKFATKAIAFHDIHDHSADSGTVPAWDDIKKNVCQTHEVYEIAHTVPRGLGIGLAVRA